ncbi:uncharacterized protein LDX57_000659 [Aspergillus melleus]|uniref:uncharacterized protein n=1 Tax=Aspergillus melleus TaxID=138277 RepID=UPI001E8E0BAA|nr:uncharacterized protein LDX57_000659 [Aspergillus melleus]KAH8422903.1 hypothetical protein LDX57_000659 [Aspergillus melleus]
MPATKATGLNRTVTVPWMESVPGAVGPMSSLRPRMPPLDQPSKNFFLCPVGRNPSALSFDLNGVFEYSPLGVVLKAWTISQPSCIVHLLHADTGLHPRNGDALSPRPIRAIQYHVS